VRVIDKELNMKKLGRMEYVTKQLIATVLSLSMVILLTGVAQAALDCTKCHGVDGFDANPVDTPAGSLPTFRNITTGAVKGNHNTHSAPTTAGNVCAKCHGDAAATYNTKHAMTNNYTIRIAKAVNYSTAFRKYTSAALFAQTADPKLGTCSSVNCHFESTTPVWGSDPLGAADINTCAKCHNAIPTTGSHTVHISEHGNNLDACAQCHTNHATSAKPFQHATSAGRPIAVFHGYTESNNKYLPSQKDDRKLGYCSTSSCHDDGLGNKVISPDWGEVVPRCSACHPTTPISGSHTVHLTAAEAVCASCHKGAVKASSVSAEHSDGNVDVYKSTPGDLGYEVDKAKGSPYTTCSTASCHVDPSTVTLGVALQKTSPVWGDASQQKCDYCHTSRPGTGSHSAHFNAGFAACAECHSGAVEGSTLSTSHDNSVIDVYKTAQGDLGYPSPKAFGSAAGKCSTSSCHDDGRGNPVLSPTWGTTAMNCTACHASVPVTGSHTQHMTGVGLTCGNCHKGAVQGTTAPGSHMNGMVDVYKTTPGDFGAAYPAAGKVKGSDFASCTTVNCHGRLSPVWGGNTPNYQCTKCHGMGVTLANYSTSTYEQSAPGYKGIGLGVGRQTGIVTSNVSSDPKVGAHDTHLRSLNNIGKPVSCSDCHTVPATAFIAGHMDGSSLPTWSNLAKNKETTPGSAIPYTYASGMLTPAYDSATGTCSATYCHGATLTDGTNTAPKWNETGYLTGDRATDCAKCHGYPPVTSTRLSHDPGNLNCAACHPHNGSRDATDVLAGKDFHINGNLEAMKYCNSCHDYDTRGTNGTLWGKNAMAVESFGAHAMHINYLKKRMNVTTMNSNEDVYGTANFDGICGVCHSRDVNDHQQANRTTSVRNINFGDAAHAAARQFGPNPPQYNGITGVSSSITPKTCSNIDCHFKTSPIWQPY